MLTFTNVSTSSPILATALAYTPIHASTHAFPTPLTSASCTVAPDTARSQSKFARVQRLYWWWMWLLTSFHAQGSLSANHAPGFHFSPAPSGSLYRGLFGLAVADERPTLRAVVGGKDVPDATDQQLAAVRHNGKLRLFQLSFSLEISHPHRPRHADSQAGLPNRCADLRR